jgi:copper chaperone NosL
MEMKMKSRARLSKTSAVAMLLVAVMILGVFVFPLWVISLVAPQYPQGLGLLIHVDRIEGASPHDLQNINGLNHYIGMHKIEPGAIAELRYMKYFVAGLAAAAALVALIRRRSVLIAWVVLAVVLSGIGMYDFYQWEYRFGHELDPSAAIKVPRMSYQPPMFGTRQMLNFQTTAWPGVGGWLAMAAVGLGAACAGYELRFRSRRVASSERSFPHQTATVSAALLLITVLLPACTKRPAALEYGTDACAYCGMTISDRRYGAVFVSDKGRSYKFDAVECMVGSLAPGEKFADVTVHSFHVADYSNPGLVVNAAGASYLVSPAVPSPMGANVSAFATRGGADSVRAEKGGDVMDWTAIQEHLRGAGS